MESLKILDKFQKSLVSFFDELIEMFQEDEGFINVLNNLKDSTKTLYYENTYITNIICKKCNEPLEIMTMAEYLDINNPKNKCKCEKIILTNEEYNNALSEAYRQGRKDEKEENN